uniref:SEA domain-containing protein n=1 Tax=Oryzias latipes TaxID=8090 RepID=A0A3P9IU29_ORYLA
MTLRYLPFIFLLGFVPKGMTAANESTPNNTTDEGLLDANSTASYMTTSSNNQFPSNVPSIATDTTVPEHVTGEFKSLTAEMSSDPRTMADTTNITINSQTNYPSTPVTSTTMAVTEPETSHSSTSKTTDTTSGTHITPTKEVTTIHMTTASTKTETSTGTMMISANTETSTGLSVPPAITGTSTGTKMTSANTETSTGLSVTPAITGTSTGTKMTFANTETSTGLSVTPAITGTSTGTKMTSANTETSTGLSVTPAITGTSTGTKMTSANTETSTGLSVTPAITGTSTGTKMTSANTEKSTGTTMTPANTEASTGTSMAYTNTKPYTGTSMAYTNTVASAGTTTTSANTELSTGLSVTPANTEASTGTSMAYTNTGTSTGTKMTSANTETSTGTTMRSANTEASTGTSMTFTNTKPYTGTSMAYTNTEASTATSMAYTNTKPYTGTSMAYTNTEASAGTTMKSTNTEASTSTTTTSANTETSTGTSMAFTNTGTSTGTQITHTHAVTTTNTEMNTGTSVTSTNITSRPMIPTSINQSGATSSQVHNTASGQTTETTTTNPTTTFSNTTLTSAATISTVLTISNDPTITVTTIRPTDNTFSTASTPTVCPAFPCPFGSVCLNGTCQCISGSYLSNGQCVQAQVFPGSLRVTSLTFDVQMSDRTSSKFRDTSANITAALRDALKNEPGYIKSDVIQLQAGSVVASVNNIFENTNASEESFKQIIDEAISKSTGLLKNATFESTLLCEQVPVPCEAASTVCTNQNGRAVCSCNEGYISTVFSNTSCKACPSGQTAVGNKCEPCSFGYAGFNCNDSSLLAVVIISVVLGGVLLILVLALLIYCCWGRCSCRRPNFGSSPYNEDLSKSWPADITPIPRATLSWDTAGAIEMTEGGSTNTLVEKNHHSNGLSASYDLNTDDMKTFKGKNTSRYSYLVEGHENPYFLPGDENKN